MKLKNAFIACAFTFAFIAGFASLVSKDWAMLAALIGYIFSLLALRSEETPAPQPARTPEPIPEPITEPPQWRASLPGLYAENGDFEFKTANHAVSGTVHFVNCKWNAVINISEGRTIEALDQNRTRAIWLCVGKWLGVIE